ncbi:MAG: efflux RND transporter periplasmic adaptor subunit [Pseudomonadales bacterium]
MKFSVKLLKTPAIILLGSIAVAVLIVFSKPEPVKTEVVIKPLLIDAIEVFRTDIRVNVQTQGVVWPRTETVLASEVAGKIIEVGPAFNVGGFFREGDLLLKIDDRNYISALKQAEAAVARSASELAQEEGRGWVAYKEWKQRNNKKDVSEEVRALAQRKPQLAEAEANLASAKAQLSRAKNDFERTSVRAPYDGLIREKNVDLGQYVQVGNRMGLAFAIDQAEIRLPVPENRLVYLDLPRAGVDDNAAYFTPVDLAYQIDDVVHHWQGEIRRTEGVLDAKSRVLHTVATVEDPYLLNLSDKVKAPDPLRVGTFVDATILGRMIDGLVRLPRNILLPGNLIWVVDSENRLQPRKVETLRTGGEEMYVSSGLEDGDMVCLTSVGTVLAGTPVRISSLRSQRDLPAELDESLIAPAEPTVEEPLEIQDPITTEDGDNSV